MGDQMTQTRIVERLEPTPVWLRECFGAIGAEAARVPADGEWSAAQVLLHMRVSDAIVSPRLLHMLLRDDPPLIAFDDEAWGRLIAGADVPIEDQLAGFSARRRELVYVLRGLSDEQWARTGQHELRGTVTIEAVAQSIVEHEAEHRAQLEACMAALRGAGVRA